MNIYIFTFFNFVTLQLVDIEFPDPFIERADGLNAWDLLEEDADEAGRPMEEYLLAGIAKKYQ